MQKKHYIDIETINKKKDNTPQFEYKTGKMMLRVKKELATLAKDKDMKKFLKV